MIGYSCRKCRRPIQASDSCTICKDAKRIIMVTGAEEPSLTEAAYETVKDLRKQLNDYRDALKGLVLDEEKEPIRNAIRQVSSAMSKILDSARKLQEDNNAAIGKMGIKEQHQLFLSWFAELPPSQRQAVTASMAAKEDELNNTNADWTNILAGERANV